MDKVIIDIISIAFGFFGFFGALKKTDIKDYGTYLGANLYKYHNDKLDNYVSYFSIGLASIAFVLQLYSVINPNIVDRLYSVCYYLIFFLITFSCLIFVFLLIRYISNRLTDNACIPDVLPSAINSYNIHNDSKEHLNYSDLKEFMIFCEFHLHCKFPSTDINDILCEAKSKIDKYNEKYNIT